MSPNERAVLNDALRVIEDAWGAARDHIDLLQYLLDTVGDEALGIPRCHVGTILGAATEAMDSIMPAVERAGILLVDPAPEAA